MRSLVLLGFFLSLFLSQFSYGQVACEVVFKREVVVKLQVVRAEPIFQQMREFAAQIEALKLFGGSARSRKRERQEIEADIDLLEKNFEKQLQKTPHLREFVDKWSHFNGYWLIKINEFHSLPELKKQELRKFMEVPVSIALKHFIAFLEAPNHRRWQMNRLNSILTIHQKHANIDLEAALFLINRQVQKFYSRWDFINCRH